MDSLLACIEASSVAQFLRGARWSYAAINGAHILGIALLIGAILPLDLKLLGFWPRVNRSDLARVLLPVAATGLGLAACMGLLLFSTRAGEYADLSLFRIKLALIAVGFGAALFAHFRHGFLLENASSRTLKAHALFSLTCWLGALACGRLIAFV